MLPAKLLRYRRSSDNRKKRKTKEKAENAKRRRSRNARATEAEKAPVNPEKTDQEGLESRVNTKQNEDEIKRLQEAAERYHRHALHFFSKWKEAETGTLRVIETNDGEGNWLGVFWNLLHSKVRRTHSCGETTAKLPGK